MAKVRIFYFILFHFILFHFILFFSRLVQVWLVGADMLNCPPFHNGAGLGKMARSGVQGSELRLVGSEQASQPASQQLA